MKSFKFDVQIENTNNFFVVKFDYLWKHVIGCCRALIAMLGVNKEELYFLKNNIHVTNKKLYFGKCLKIIL
jgi:hypothetical protein